MIPMVGCFEQGKDTRRKPVVSHLRTKVQPQKDERARVASRPRAPLNERDKQAEVKRTILPCSKHLTKKNYRGKILSRET